MDYDLIVIGGGPGGYVAAIRGSQLGLKVAVIEREHLGGICLNWGCIPSKALLKTAEMVHFMHRSSDFGIDIEGFSVDFGRVIDRSRSVAGQLSKGIAFLLKKNKIDHIAGEARLASPSEVHVRLPDGHRSLTASHVIVATGARPRPIPGMEFDGEQVLSYKDALGCRERPERLVIIGAGAIGVEFAYFFNAMGTAVTLVEMLPQILPVEDAEVSEALKQSFLKQGIAVKTGARTESHEIGDHGVRLILDHEGSRETVEADAALVAIGVLPNSETLGLEELGVELDRGFIKVDERLRTSVEGVYAIGDIAGPPMLAHKASAEGIACVEGIVDHEFTPVDYANIPGCTYCHPQVASVGMTEEKARDAGHELKIGRFPFSASGKSIAIGEREGFVKLIFDAKYGELLGAHIIGADATELIAELGLARALESTYLEVLKTVHAHPTLSEAVMEAAGDAVDEAIHI